MQCKMFNEKTTVEDFKKKMWKPFKNVLFTKHATFCQLANKNGFVNKDLAESNGSKHSKEGTILTNKWKLENYKKLSTF